MTKIISFTYKIGIAFCLLTAVALGAQETKNAPDFANYKETKLEFTPQIKPYKVVPDLSNIINKNDFQFSAEQKKLLTQNAFVVTSKSYLEFFEVYENNRYAQLPNFITTDSLLHNYHLLYKHLLNNVEQEKFLPELIRLTGSMLAVSQKQYQELRGTKWENAAKRNVAYFAVATKLLSPQAPIPALVQKEVAAELQLITTHKDITLSPSMNIGATPNNLALEGFKEDYSQYLPRGHYSLNEKSKSYFKAMMWYGRMTLRLKNPDEMRSIVLLTLALNNGTNLPTWNKIYEPINFFVGKSDDLTIYQFNDLVAKIYGNNPTLKSVIDADIKLQTLIAAANKLAPPKINSIPIFIAALQPEREHEIKGFRFFGQRFTIDAAIFQQLIVRAVGPKNEPCVNKAYDEGRMLPKALDIPAAFGSKTALDILQDQGELAYACYPENMSKIKDYIATLSQNIWTQNLYWSWLYALLPLTQEKTTGYPAFMTNSAWAKKELNTFLGNWTELKHDTILYAKQVYAEMGDGGEEPKDDRGYVEPNFDVYARLEALLKITISGLEERNLLSPKNKELLGLMLTLTNSLKTITEKELSNKGLSAKEYELIRSYGGQLEHFWLEALKGEGVESTSQLSEKPAAIVADVATDPNGTVLEEATGHIGEIYVVVPIAGKLRLASGGVYSYYEFPWPLKDRLTDETWRGLLLDNKAPELPSWTKEFTATDEKVIKN